VFAAAVGNANPNRRRPRHLISDGISDPFSLSHEGGIWCANAVNGGKQTVKRESDAVVVPLIPGNAGGGKE